MLGYQSMLQNMIRAGENSLLLLVLPLFTELSLGCGPNSKVTVGSDKWGRWLSGDGSDNSLAGTAGSLLIL